MLTNWPNEENSSLGSH